MVVNQTNNMMQMWSRRSASMTKAGVESEMTSLGKINCMAVDSDGTVVLRWIHPLPIDGELIRPSPRTLQPFQYPKPEVDES